MEWESLRDRLLIGETIQLLTESPIYRGPYSTTVLEKEESALRIAMPLDAGRLVLIPVGTRCRIRLEGEEETEAVVVDRIGGGERLLVLQPPAPPAESASAATLVEAPSRTQAPVLAVTSGKGGVGKTTFAVNVGIALEALGRRACIIDVDLGTANVDVLLRLSPPFNLGDVVSGKKHMVEVLVEGPKGVLVLPGGSGLRSLTRLPEDAFLQLMSQFQELEEFADVILLDTGSGIAPNVTHFVAASSAAILLTTPEPHAVTDAYALLRMLVEEGHRVPVHLVVNRIKSLREGDETTKRMIYAARRFLQYEVQPLGQVHEDPAVSRAISQQADLLSVAPRARVTQDLQSIAEQLAETLLNGTPPSGGSAAGAIGFLRKMRSLLSGRGSNAAMSQET